MKTLRNIFINPAAIAVAGVHWLVVIFAFLTEDNPFNRNTAKICLHCNNTLFEELRNLNIISFSIIEFILAPILSVFNNDYFINGTLILMLVLLINFQWMCIGYVVNLLYNLVKYKETKLSLND
ncbi:MAG: hypothetical protein M3388_00165 [Acidobacteriota bacterium]|nr:hypothetical protein [Acidobacteriota bacterium]